MPNLAWTLFGVDLIGAALFALVAGTAVWLHLRNTETMERRHHEVWRQRHIAPCPACGQAAGPVEGSLDLYACEVCKQRFGGPEHRGGPLPNSLRSP